MSARLPRLLLALVATVLLVGAAGILFTTYMRYDDEGYVLYSYRMFFEHGRLYSDIYTQYGPFPYVAYALFHLLGMPFTLVGGRLVVLLEWTAASVLCSSLVWRMTRSFIASLFTLVAVFALLWVMIAEPSHPGGLISLLTALMAWIGATGFVSGRTRRTFALLGAGVAALFLTKINVGLLAGMSLVAVLVLNQRGAIFQKGAPWAYALLMAVVPFGLMMSLIGTPWVHTFAILAGLAGISCVAAAARSRTPTFGLREWKAAALAGLGLAVVACGVVLAKGTRVADLLDGIILGPIKHPARFSVEFHWAAPALAAGVISCVLCLGLGLYARQGAAQQRRAARVVAGLRLLVGTGVIFSFLGYPDNFPERALFSYLGAGIWPFIWPVADESSSSFLGRAWLGLLLLGQWLHAYPVAGSQIAWGLFLCLPLVAVGAAEALAALTTAWHEARPAATQALRAVVLVGTLGFSLYLAFRFVDLGTRYNHGRNLRLDGAEVLRLPEGSETSLEVLSLNAEVHGDMLFTMPGMLSFNLWTGLPTPTHANTTHWFSLLSEEQQRGIITALGQDRRPVIIVQTDLLDFLHQAKIEVTGPLKDYIDQNFTTAFTLDGYAFAVRKGRTVCPFGFYEVFRRPDGAGSFLRLRLILPPGRTIAKAVYGPIEDFVGPTRVISANDGAVEVTPINLAGQAVGPAEHAHLPLTLKHPSVVDLYVPDTMPVPNQRAAAVVLSDPDGAEIATLRALK